MTMRSTRRAAIAFAAAAATTAALLAAAGTAAGSPRSVPRATDGVRVGQAHHVMSAQRRAASVSHNPLLNEILSGEEEETVDDPALSALCQDFVGKPNPYADPAPNVDQIVGDTIVTTGSQTGCSSAQNETTIAVNPNNPQNIVAGTNDYRVFNSREQRNDSSGWAYTTFDGGKTWTNVQLPHLTFQTGATGALSYMDSAGDPVLSFGPNNTVYYGNIAFSRAAPTPGGSQVASAIVVNVSHDGGLHWSDPVIIRKDGVDDAGNPQPTNFFNDKIWLAGDKTSGRVYVTWTRFQFDSDGNYIQSPIVVARGTHYGKVFKPFKRVDVALRNPPQSPGLVPFSQGSNPQVGRDGTLYVAYEGEVCATLACDQAGDRDVTVVATSHNHGRTFSRAIVDTNFDFPFNPDLGTLALTGENFRINSYPQLSYDPVYNQLAVTWADDRNGKYDPHTGASIRSNGDNLVSVSSDGLHWSRPRVLGTRQDEVFGAVADYAGTIAVASYTRHYDRHGIDLDYAYWTMKKPGKIHRITTQSENPQVQFVAQDEDGNIYQGVFIGDYTAAALGADMRLHPCWTDFRGNPGLTDPNQDAYTQSIRLR
jgi:hypothetical protein